MRALIPALLTTPPSTGDLGGWFHDLSPILVHVFGLPIRWYGLSYLTGFVIAFLVLRALAKRSLVRIPVERVGDAMLLLIAGVVVGGRLGYVLLYQPSLLWMFTPNVPWWGVLQLTHGGMASHGGMIGVIIAAWVVSRGFRDDDGNRVGTCPPLHVMDAMALVAPFGLMLGRLANFINGELLGRVVAKPGEHAPWWAVRFPQEVVSGQESFRTPAQEQAIDAIIAANALPTDHDAGQVWDRILHLIRQGGEHGETLRAQIEPLISARHPSQLYQALAEGVIVGLVVWFVFRKPRQPGVVGAWFLISYGILRVATEFYRLPDSHFAGGGIFNAARPLGLSRGQWLSTAMVAVGAVILWLVTRREGPRFGGWLTGPPVASDAQPSDAGDAEVSSASA